MVVMTIQKIIYMEAAPFEFYLEEKKWRWLNIPTF